MLTHGGSVASCALRALLLLAPDEVKTEANFTGRQILRDCQEITQLWRHKWGRIASCGRFSIGALQLGTRPQERRCNRRAGCNPAPLGVSGSEQLFLDER
jgi:hypothetical protein